MELRINLVYEQILQLVRQLPRFEKQRLSHEIERELWEEVQQAEEAQDFDKFQQLLLNGPVMSDEQFEQFQDLRKGLNAWIESCSVAIAESLVKGYRLFRLI